MNTDFPSDTLIQNYWLPTIRAEIAIRAADPDHAGKLLRAAGPYELSSESPLLPTYIRAEAFLSARKGKAAAAEFQKILQHRGILGNSGVGALAQLGLARAYAASGDLANARTKYESFLALWKNADQDVPILKRAQAEYAMIH